MSTAKGLWFENVQFCASKTELLDNYFIEASFLSCRDLAFYTNLFEFRDSTTYDKNIPGINNSVLDEQKRKKGTTGGAAFGLNGTNTSEDADYSNAFYSRAGFF